LRRERAIKIRTKNEIINSEIMKMSVARELFPLVLAEPTALSLGLATSDGFAVGVVTTAGASKVKMYEPERSSPSIPNELIGNCVSTWFAQRPKANQRLRTINQ